jgi:hypothetical protein
MSMKTRFGVAFVLAACSLAVTGGTAHGWSSAIGAVNMPVLRVISTGAFGTHQFLTERARQLLAEHPVLRAGFIRFPEAEELARNGSIILDQTGLGPDNPENSQYSWHWYNPNLVYEKGMGNGKTPKLVEEYFQNLKNIFKSRGLNEPPPPIPPGNISDMFGAPHDAAHEAAYLAHFIQDMTCAFHVVGMPIAPLPDPGPIRAYGDFAVKKLMIGGPFRTFTPEDWDTVVGNAAEAFAKDNKADWFDPNYYDGNMIAYVEDSGHFQYEGAVEVAYKADALNHTSRWDALLATGLVSPVWRRSMSAEEFTRGVAAATASKYLTTGRDLYSLEKRNNHVNPEVPYDDWWKAIQATYTLYRSTFTALIILAEDLKLVKLPNEKDAYQVQAVIRNMEPEADATEVSLAYWVLGTRDDKGEGKVAKIDMHTASPWLPLSGKVRISDTEVRGGEIFYKGSGKIRLEIAGKYPIPDAESAVHEYDLRDIRIEGKVLPDMTGWKRAEVEDYLNSNEFKLVAREDAGIAETPEQEDTVKGQLPLPRTIVAARDTITVSFLGKFKVKVPNITQPAVLLQRAVQMIRDARLSVKEPLWHVQVDDSIPEGTAMEQDPQPGALVPPGSGVTFKVAVHRPVTYPTPLAPLDCYANIEIEPQNPYTTVNQRLKLRATVNFYDSPNGVNELKIPLDRAQFEWRLETQEKEDWPAGEVVLLTTAGPEATLTPVAAGLVIISCKITNVINQNLATDKVMVIKERPGGDPPADPTQPPRTDPPPKDDRPPIQPEIKRDPVVPIEESTELEGSWKTSSDMVVDFRRIGGNDYQGTLTQLLTAKKYKFYKELLGQVTFLATRTGPGTYALHARNGVNPKTGEVIWVYDYAFVTVRGNSAQVNKGLAWTRVSN